MPENFNELTGEQLIKINALLLLEAPKSLVRLMLLKVLLNINAYQFFKLPADCKNRLLFYDKMEDEFLSNDDHVESCIDWVFTVNNLTEQVLPVYKGYYGPKSEFDNLRVKEFHVTEMAYADYVQEETDDLLNTLVAVLYRPCKVGYNHTLDSDGDARIPFNYNELDHYKKIVGQWPPEARLSIFQFYDGCREYIKDLYDEIFNSSNNQQQEETESGMYEIIRSLSGSKYGTFKDVENMLLHDVLKEIESSIKETERQEELLKQQG